MDQAVSTRPTLAGLLRPGERVFVAGITGESALLREELKAFPESARDVEFTCVQFPGIDRTDFLGAHPHARMTGFLMSPSMRAGLAQQRAHLLPLDYNGIARHLEESPPFDLAIAQFAPPDAQGWCSPGLSCDFTPLVWGRARRRAAHLNPRLPRVRSSFRVHVSEIDTVVEADAPLLTMAIPPVNDTSDRIAGHAAALVRDGDTLQFGVGSVPPAIASALTSHRRLRIHSGLVSPAMRTLWESGSLDAKARITAGVLLGDEAFYDFAARLETLYLADVRQTHHIAQIAGIDRFVAINGAVEVDLFGQVNSERGGGLVQAGAGGLPAFAQGAQYSRGGRLLICLPSTARAGRLSRIVTALDREGLCTLPRHLSDAVVTEYGVAELRGLPMQARAEALIAIAHPGHRDRLASQWEDVRRRM